MKVSVLGSGSGGNCVYLATEKTRILVDAGFGIRSLRRRCREAGLGLDQIDALLVTHGHWDHVAGLGSLLQSLSPVVYVNEGTDSEVLELRKLERKEIFHCNGPFAVGDLAVQAFPTPHDSAESVGFRISCGDVTGAVATDLGEMTGEVKTGIAGCDWLILEANHDEDLVKIGPYPWPLKMRVLGNRGHLSNKALAEFLGKEFDGAARHLFLAHLSRQNNTPELALDTIRESLDRRASFGYPGAVEVHLTRQSNPSIVLDL